MRLKVFALAAALASVVVACSAAGDRATPAAPATATAAPAARPSPSATPVFATLTPEPDVLPEGVARAITLLASASGASPQFIRLDSWDRTAWPDSSLGCPEPGKSYAQVVTPGWKIVLSAPDGQHEFHADAGGRLVDCTEVLAGQADTVNLARSLALRTAVGVTVLRRLGDPPEFREIAGITDAAETALLVSSLDQDIALAPRGVCEPLFKVVFRFAAEATQAFEAICARDVEVIRGDQQVWGGKQGRMPVGFGDLIGKYASQVPFPGFPDK